jgi:hypothetical protein
MMRFMLRAALLLACVTTASQAQLGSLIKKAKEKVEGKVEEKTGVGTDSKPLAGDPVSVSVLDALLKGLALEVQADAKAKELRAVRDAKNTEINDAEKAAGDEPDKWKTADRELMRCVSKSIDESEAKHAEELVQHIMNAGSDPAFLKRYTEWGQRLNAATQKVPMDSAALRRVNEEKFSVIGATPAKDSAIAFGKCGKRPAKPASLVKVESLKLARDKVNEELRRAEADINEKAAAAAGIAPDKYFLARERLYTWNSERKEKNGKRSVTKDEDALFKSRAADIKKVDAALR